MRQFFFSYTILLFFFFCFFYKPNLVFGSCKESGTYTACNNSGSDWAKDCTTPYWDGSGWQSSGCQAIPNGSCGLCQYKNCDTKSEATIGICGGSGNGCVGRGEKPGEGGCCGGMTVQADGTCGGCSTQDSDSATCTANGGTWQTQTPSCISHYAWGGACVTGGCNQYTTEGTCTASGECDWKPPQNPTCSICSCGSTTPSCTNFTITTTIGIPNSATGTINDGLQNNINQLKKTSCSDANISWYTNSTVNVPAVVRNGTVPIYAVCIKTTDAGKNLTGYTIENVTDGTTIISNATGNSSYIYDISIVKSENPGENQELISSRLAKNPYCAQSDSLTSCFNSLPEPVIEGYPNGTAITASPPISPSIFDSKNAKKQDSGKTISWNHTVEDNTYGLMIVGVSYKGDQTSSYSSDYVNTVVFTDASGTAKNLTKILGGFAQEVVGTNPGARRHTSLWYYSGGASPFALGKGTVVVNFKSVPPDPQQVVAGSATYTQVDQTTPIANVATTDGNQSCSSDDQCTAISADLNVSANATQTVFGIIATQTESPILMGSGNTTRWNRSTTVGGFNGQAGDGLGETDGSKTLSWKFSNSLSHNSSRNLSWAISAVAINPRVNRVNNTLYWKNSDWGGVCGTLDKHNYVSIYSDSNLTSPVVSNVDVGKKQFLGLAESGYAFNLAPLYDTTYYWQIQSSNVATTLGSNLRTKGPVWNFTIPGSCTGNKTLSGNIVRNGISQSLQICARPVGVTNNSQDVCGNFSGNTFSLVVPANKSWNLIAQSVSYYSPSYSSNPTGTVCADRSGLGVTYTRVTPNLQVIGLPIPDGNSGQSTNISATVRNVVPNSSAVNSPAISVGIMKSTTNGSGCTGPYDSTYLLNSDLVYGSDQTQSSISFTYPTNSGSAVACAKIDTLGTVTETNESDNVIYTPYNVQSQVYFQTYNGDVTSATGNIFNTNSPVSPTRYYVSNKTTGNNAGIVSAGGSIVSPGGISSLGTNPGSNLQAYTTINAEAGLSPLSVATITENILQNMGITSSKLTELCNLGGSHVLNNSYKVWCSAGTLDLILNSIKNDNSSNASTYFHVITGFSGDQTISQVADFSAVTRKMVLLISNGHLRVNSNINLGTNSQLLVFNEGSVNVDETVTRLDGAFVFNGNFNDNPELIANTSTLTVNGMIIGVGKQNQGKETNSQVLLKRSGNNQPGELIYYKPEYMSTFQNVVFRPEYKIRELPPQ